MLNKLIIFQYVTMPNRRSTANSLQILIMHLFGDAGSPYLIGVVSFCLMLLKYIYIKSVISNNKSKKMFVFCFQKSCKLI